MFTKRIWIVSGITMMMCLACVVSADRIEQNFNRDWRFVNGDLDAATVAQPVFDDALWEPVQLPHDWAISGPFNPRENGYAGKLPWGGVGWYRMSLTANAAAPNTLTADEKKAGFKLLFDGKSADGWRGINSNAFPAKGWIVKDGMIVGNPPEDPAQRGGGDIVTVETFGDFELSLECRLGPASNSGIKYLVSDELSRKAKSGIGLEFQLIDEPGWLAKGEKLSTKQSFGAIYDIKTPDGSQPLPVGQWNHVRIVVKGSHIEHWVNGRKVIDADRSSPEFAQWIAASKFKNMAGFAPLGPTRILLQDHPGTVAFRSIKLRLLQP